MEKDSIMIIDDEKDDIATFIANVHHDFDIDELDKFDKFAVINKLKKSDTPIKAVILDLYDKNNEGREQAKGIDVLREIRSNFRKEELPVLIYTTQSKAHIEDAVKCIQEGAQDWIWKDHDKMTTAERIARIKKAIEQSKIEYSRENRLQQKDQKQEKVFWAYGSVVCFFSLLSMILGFFDKSFFGSYVTPIILLLSLGVSLGLSNKIKLAYKSKESSFTAEVTNK